jgi:hypothetical protein
MTSSPPEDHNADEMAWPRATPPDTDTDTTADEQETAAPESMKEAQQLEQVLRDRTPHARPLTGDDDDDEDHDEDATTPAATEREIAPEILAALEAERQERFKLQREADPIIAMMVVGAISIGSTPLDAVVRYVILWALLCIAGVLAYVLGRAQQEAMRNDLDDLVAGVGFGMGVGLPILIALGGPMADISGRMFDAGDIPRSIMDTWVFMAVVFVQPTAESLFFRGAMQQFRSLPLTALLATIWSIVLFFPHMEIGGFLTLAVMIAAFFAFLSFLYSYVRLRNGLSAAWICQVVSGSLIWFFPRLLFG